MKDIFKFLKELGENNNREWFNANKERYLKIKAKSDAIAQQLINGVTSFNPEASFLTVPDCTYRIYRDTRFSPDKTPYKTHIGVFINPPYGKKSNRLGYYLHIEPGKSMVCAGTICLPSKTVTAIRQSIYENIDEYLEIVRDPDFASVFPVIGENLVKTAPKGFSKDWEFINLVRPRDFVVSHSLTDKEMMSLSLSDDVTSLFRAAKHWVDFINFTIDEEGNH